MSQLQLQWSDIRRADDKLPSAAIYVQAPALEPSVTREGIQRVWRVLQMHRASSSTTNTNRVWRTPPTRPKNISEKLNRIGG